MRYDEKPVFRRLIVPWYDSGAACFIVITFMILVFLFAFTGIVEACMKVEYHEHVWVPSLLLLMSIWVVVSTSIRLVRRYKYRSLKSFNSEL